MSVIKWILKLFVNSISGKIGKIGRGGRRVLLNLVADMRKRTLKLRTVVSLKNCLLSFYKINKLYVVYIIHTCAVEYVS
jgi:hypothetical protein